MQTRKTSSYRLMLSGGIVSTIGIIIILLTFITIKEFTPQIIGFIIGGIISFIGMILNLTGEIILAKNYKKITKKVDDK